jgi:alpha-tubulin suppressor-like RCC1 family protein
LAVGITSACAIMADTTVRCWGFNGNGELGDTTKTNRSTPTEVQLANGSGVLSGAVDISSGGASTCVVLTDGGVACWGPSPVVGLAFAAAVAPAISGAVHVAISPPSDDTACVLFQDGGVSCMGGDFYGQLGRTGCDADTCPLQPVVGLP